MMMSLLNGLTGWDPYVPNVVAGLVVYGTVLLLALLLTSASKVVLSGKLLFLSQEFIKTCAFCSYPFGHGIMRHYYGEQGFYLSAVPLFTLTVLLLPVGEPTPVSVWISYLTGKISKLECIARIGLQIFAGLFAYRVGMMIYSSNLHPIYEQTFQAYYHHGTCASVLKVHCLIGALTEMVAIVVDCLVRSNELSANRKVDTFLKFMSTCLLVSIGFPLTGMCINPALATGITFGCGSTTTVEHIVSFWGGPFAGAAVAVSLLGNRRGTATGKDKTE